MSATPHPSVADLAAQQVEQIVAAAQRAAEEIRREARLELEAIRAEAQREQEEALGQARLRADEELRGANKQAIVLGQDARRDARGILEEARAESARIQEQSKRAVEGRTAAAERAAAEVLEEARALSGGLRQLGRSLEDHADRILRDVQAAHKRMQADLRVGAGPARTSSQDRDPAPVMDAPRTTVPGAARPPGSAASGPRDRTAPGEEAPAQEGRFRRNPLDELEVPSWVEGEEPGRA